MMLLVLVFTSSLAGCAVATEPVFGSEVAAASSEGECGAMAMLQRSATSSRLKAQQTPDDKGDTGDKDDKDKKGDKGPSITEQVEDLKVKVDELTRENNELRDTWPWRWEWSYSSGLKRLFNIILFIILLALLVFACSMCCREAATRHYSHSHPHPHEYSTHGSPPQGHIYDEHERHLYDGVADRHRMAYVASLPQTTPSVPHSRPSAPMITAASLGPSQTERAPLATALSLSPSWTERAPLAPVGVIQSLPVDDSIQVSSPRSLPAVLDATAHIGLQPVSVRTLPPRGRYGA